MAKKYEIRLTFHPGQYTLLSSHREDVTQNSILDLKMHCEILDAMEMGKDSIIILHGGSKNGGKTQALERFIENFKRLPQNVKDRIVLENCEMSYSI